MISSAAECPIFVCFCFGWNSEIFILIQPTQMLDYLLLMKSFTKILKVKAKRKKTTVISKERKLKFVNNLVSHKGSSVWVGWIQDKFFLKFDPKQNQTNVGHSVTNEIINGCSRNIRFKLRKEPV